MKRFTSADGAIVATCVLVGEERYILIWDDSTRGEALRTLGRWASHPELSFNWYSAAAASMEIRKQ